MMIHITQINIIYIYIYIHTHMRTHTHIYIYIYIYIGKSELPEGGQMLAASSQKFYLGKWAFSNQEI